MSDIFLDYWRSRKVAMSPGNRVVDRMLESAGGQTPRAEMRSGKPKGDRSCEELRQLVPIEVVVPPKPSLFRSSPAEVQVATVVALPVLLWALGYVWRLVAWAL